MYSSIQTSQTITCRCFEVLSVRFIFHVVFLLFPSIFFHEYFPLNPSLCLEGWLNQDYILCMFLIYLNQIDCFNAPDCVRAGKKQKNVSSEIKANITIKSASQISHRLPEVYCSFKTFLHVTAVLFYHISLNGQRWTSNDKINTTDSDRADVFITQKFETLYKLHE